MRLLSRGLICRHELVSQFFAIENDAASSRPHGDGLEHANPILRVPADPSVVFVDDRSICSTPNDAPLRRRLIDDLLGRRRSVRLVLSLALLCGSLFANLQSVRLDPNSLVGVCDPSLRDEGVGLFLRGEVGGASLDALDGFLALLVGHIGRRWSGFCGGLLCQPAINELVGPADGLRELLASQLLKRRSSVLVSSVERILQSRSVTSVDGVSDDPVRRCQSSWDS